MLEPNGRQLVQILGKAPGQPGIVTVEQIPGAIAAIEAAIAAEESARDQAPEEAQGEDGAERSEAVHLRQRAAPLLDMLRRSAAEGREVTW
jgi:cyclopropane-fatty-acyl-phospholipid synthase